MMWKTLLYAYWHLDILLSRVLLLPNFLIGKTLFLYKFVDL